MANTILKYHGHAWHMALFLGPYTYALIADTMHSVQPDLLHRMLTRRTPAYYALSLRRIKRSTSLAITHEGSEFVNELLDSRLDSMSSVPTGPTSPPRHLYESFIQLLVGCCVGCCFVWVVATVLHLSRKLLHDQTTSNTSNT